MARVTPTFLLRGVDLTELRNRYNSGYYARYQPKRINISLASNDAIVAPSYGADTGAGSYTFKDRNNTTLVFATSNQRPFETFSTTGETKGGQCDWCRDEFSHESIGIPIAMNAKTILDDSGQNHEVYSFMTEGCFCSYECALAEVQRSLSLPCYNRDILYNNSESWLKMMYHLATRTTNDLKATPDPRLLRRNGGALERSDIRRHQYQRASFIIQAPCKVGYIQYNA